MMTGIRPVIFAVGALALAGLSRTQAAALSFLIGDEGNGKIHRVTPGKPAQSWSIPLAGNRDLQLIGGNRFLANSENGFAEYDLTTGAQLKKTAYTGIGSIQSLRRLQDGRTLVGANTATGVVFAFLNAAGAEQKRVSYAIAGPVYRMMRYTDAGHFLFGSGDRVIELDSTGKEMRNIRIPPSGALRFTAYKVVSKGNGVLWATTGYAKSLVEISSAGAVKNIVADSTDMSYFYNDFQIMPDGHFFATDWWGHGPGNGGKGPMLREFDAKGKEIWKWQDSVLVSSAHAVIVLDGLDLERPHDDFTGIQTPVSPNRLREPMRAGRNASSGFRAFPALPRDWLGRAPIFAGSNMLLR